MKAIVATGYGSHEVLQYTEVYKPFPKENEVRVKIHASSATMADVMMLTGKPYIGRLFVGLNRPKYPVPGTGFAGVVESVGEKVTKFREGDEVFGETTVKFSTNAEYVTVSENGVILHKPEKLGFTDAAPFCDGPLTSINFLKELAKIKPDHKVLINGASGSLGTAAVQLAKHYGAKVTGVCSTANIDLVKSLGADHVIDYTKQDFFTGSERYDIVYDTVGKSSFGTAAKVLGKNGLYISPVLKFGLLLHMVRTSLSGNKKARFAASGLKPDNELRTLLAELVEIYESGHLKMVIDRRFPLEETAKAHAYISKGHKKGNVVITHQA